MVWAFEADAPIGSAPATDRAGRKIYFGTTRPAPAVYSVGCDGDLDWRFEYGGERPDFERPQGFEGSPAVGDDGAVYVGDDVLIPNFFFCLRPDGTARWVFETKAVNSDMDVSPALDHEGRSFTGAASLTMDGYGGQIIGLDDEGHRLAGYDFDSGPIEAAPVVLAGDRIVYLSSPGYRRLWVTPTPSTTYSGSATASPSATMPRTVTATVEPTATASATITAYRTTTPTSQPTAAPVALALPLVQSSWVPQPAWPTISPGIDAQGYTEDFPARLYLISDGGPPTDAGEVTAGRLERLVSSLAGAGDMVVCWVGEETGRLMAYEIGPPATKLWEHETEHPLAGAPLLGRREPSRGTFEVYYFDSSGELWALTAWARAGTPPAVKWRSTLPAPAEVLSRQQLRLVQAPALGDAGLLYVASGYDADAGHPPQVTAVRVSDGEVEWSIPLDGAVPSTAVTLAPGGVLYFGAGRTVYAVSTESSGLDPEALWPGWRHDASNTGRADR